METETETETKLFDVYVIWATSGNPYTSTLLQFDDTDDQRQVMQEWSPRTWVAQAWDAENADDPGPNPVLIGEVFDLIAIFEASNVRFIY